MEEKGTELQSNIRKGLDALYPGARSSTGTGNDVTISTPNDHIYVDASDVGIGFVFANQWQAWRLKTGWREGKIREIQWAEAAAVDLGVRLMIEAGFSGKEIILHLDKQQVVDAISQIHPIGPKKGFAEQVVREVIGLCRESEVRLSAQWIRGVSNLADRASRLQFEPTEKTRIPYHVEIPPYLQEFVVPYEQ